MKKAVLTLVMMFFAAGLFAQTGITVKSSSYNNLKLSFKAPSTLVADEVTLKDRDFSAVNMDGFGRSSAIGCPALPTMREMIEIPLCDGITVQVESESHIVVDGASMGVSHQVMPVQPSECKTASRNSNVLAFDAEVYAADGFYGLDVVSTEKVGVARDRNLAQVVFSPVKYNPVTNQFMIYTEVEAVLVYNNPDKSATKEMKRRYYSPAFGGGVKTINTLDDTKDLSMVSAPIRYLIVADPMFRGELDEFVDWKRRTGFLVDEVYTDESGVGTTLDEIKAFVKRQYSEATTASPAPTFVLFVGDQEQIPATLKIDITNYWFFQDTSIQASDLYYACWTDGDNIPDCYYGRLSAQTVDQLTPQLQKILLYEKYEFPDPSFLDVAMLVSGIDQGTSNDNAYKYCDPTMDYIAKFYVNGDYGYSTVYEYKNNTSINPNAANVTVSTNATSAAASIRTKYSEGAGWINYSAHGDWDRWYSPELTTTQVAQMTNVKKCGVMIGNCCLTGKFDETTCFAESLLRQGNYSGAAAYIGASNSTYWTEDFYWAVGVRSSISGSMTQQYMANNRGMYDDLFHTHGEDHTLWAPTIGEMMFNGNMAVQNSSSSSDNKLYYWEIYHTFGDPSMMPWLTQAEEMNVVYSGMSNGSTTVYVTSVPYAYVALTDADNNLLGVAFADESGVATLTLNEPLVTGNYVIAASAQNYQTALLYLEITESDVTPSQFTVTVAADPANAGTVAINGNGTTLTVENGTTVTISAVANDGYRFVGWNDAGTDASRAVTVTADVAYTARFEVDPLAIDDVTEVAVQLYPNPTTGKLVVEAEGLQRVEVIDAVGRVAIVQTSGKMIDMRGLAGGVYTVRLTVDGKTLLRKVVKNNL